MGYVHEPGLEIAILLEVNLWGSVSHSVVLIMLQLGARLMPDLTLRWSACVKVHRKAMPLLVINWVNSLDACIDYIYIQQLHFYSIGLTFWISWSVSVLSFFSFLDFFVSNDTTDYCYNYYDLLHVFCQCVLCVRTLSMLNSTEWWPNFVLITLMNCVNIYCLGSVIRSIKYVTGMLAQVPVMCSGQNELFNHLY